MATPASNVQGTLQKVCDFFYRNAFLKTNAVENIRQGEGYHVHQLLCAYLVHHETGLDLPQEIIDAAGDLTPALQEKIEALGLIAGECRDIERAIEEEWAALPGAAKAHIRSNARKTRSKIQAFSDGMPLWQSIMLSAMTGGAISWDVWSASNVPDTSLFPRVIPFGVATIPLTIGFLIAPGANWPQYFNAVFQDKIFLGITQRINLTTGIHHDDFYQDKPRFITSVGVSSVLLMLMFNLPQKIIAIKQNMDTNKAGKMPPPEDEVAELLAIRDAMMTKSERLNQYQKALKDLAEQHIVSQGLEDGLTKISGEAHRTSELLRRTAGRYVAEERPDFVKKSQIVILWDTFLGFMFYSARENDAQIGALIPYASFAKMRMLEVLLTHTQSLQDMINLFARSGALALLQLASVSVVLQKKGPRAFDDVKLKAGVTVALSTINLTVIQYGPAIMFALQDAGTAFARFARKKWQDRGDGEFFDAIEYPDDEPEDEVFHDALEIFLNPNPTDRTEGSEPDEFFDAHSTWEAVMDIMNDTERALGTTVE